MTNGNPFIDREESISGLWLIIILITTVLAILVNILSLSNGNNAVAPHLFYIPVVIAAFWYPHRGPACAVFIALVYLSLVYLFSGSDVAMLVTSSVICFVMIGVSVIVSSLATRMRKNEVKYRGIFNHLQTGVGLVDTSSLRIIEANPCLAGILGYTVEELTRIPFPDLFCDADQKDAFFSQLNPGHSIDKFEARFLSKNEGSRWMLISAGRLPGNQVVVTVVDITDRRQRELALQAKDDAIRSSTSAIAITDPDFTITYVNESFVRLMEYPGNEEAVGRTITDLVSSPQRFATVRDALVRNGSWSGEIALIRYNRKPFFVLLRVNTVKDNSGNPTGILASFIDITDRKQVEAAKRKALEQIAKNIEQFAVLGDNIRNPLAVIVGLSSLAPGEITGKIILQTKEIDRIIARLDKGRIESEKVRGIIRKYYPAGTGDSVIPDESGAIPDEEIPGGFGKA
ncbi:MAG: PAS domain-containing protein [Methanoregula sp.]|jgi:PAS domain S-box-containing protein|nr:PAS domain-containing protein [Methanoregula sp.]